MPEKTEKTEKQEKNNLQKALNREHKRIKELLDSNFDPNMVCAVIELSKYRLFLADCVDKGVLDQTARI